MASIARAFGGGRLFALMRGWHDLAALILIAGLVASHEQSVFEPIGRALVTARMKAVSEEASGALVFVAIDPVSTKALGPWPWPRSLDAELIRRLRADGVNDIFLNLDLSTRTDPAADAELARELERAGASVVLPIFQQRASVSGDAVASNLPLPEFRTAAWLATVNLTASEEGIVRRYPYAAVIDGEEIPSVAALLSGEFGSADQEFLVNFALDPATVPALSALEVMESDHDIDLSGKTVVVGPHALELRDSVTVPVHGVISGSMLHILAAETMLQGLELRCLNPYLLLGCITVLALALMAASRGRPAIALTTLAAGMAVLELLAIWLHWQYAIILPTAGSLAVLVGAQVIVGERELKLRHRLLRMANIETSKTDRILERVIADSTDAIVVADGDMRVLRMSRSARTLFEVPEDAGPGSILDEVVPREMADAARASLASDVDGATVLGERRLTLTREEGDRHIEFTARPSRLGQTTKEEPDTEANVIVCLTARDVTAAREHRERMDRLARFDALTGALNRTEFLERLAARIEGGAEGCAVIAFNLHRLQTVNATLGRDIGDALLVALVRRLTESNLGLSVARLGGDRFAAFTLQPTSAAKAQATTQRLSRFVEAPFRLGNQTVRIALRAGVAEGAPGDDAELLLGKAELALDEARMRDGPGLRTFNQASFVKEERARKIERAHWTSLVEEEVFLAYQPQVRLSDGMPVGAEALLRWKSPVLGQVAPSEFIGIAEGSGFIEHLGRWVMETACLDAVAWPEHLSVSVNVSPAQFHRSDVVADAERALAVSGLAPGRLCLEITESLFFDGTRTFSDTFDGLRRLGVSLALDDFGSGFSSFAHLSRLPLQKLKVDRMFVHGLEEVPFNQAVVRAIVTLCRELGLIILCEGVECDVQAKILRELGCDEAQGFHYGRPELQKRMLERIAKAGASPQRVG